MAVKPAKAIADLLARKQILKVDKENNILFKVSGSLGSGAVSSYGVDADWDSANLDRRELGV